jgi:hypothetical protein
VRQRGREVRLAGGERKKTEVDEREKIKRIKYKGKIKIIIIF